MSSAVSSHPVPHPLAPRFEAPAVHMTLRTDRATDLDVAVIAHDADSVTVALFGELDVTNTDVVDRALREQAARGRRFVRVDLAGVSFCDCAGLCAIVEAHDRQLACRGTLVLTGVTPIVARLLDVSHLDESLFVADGPGDPPHVHQPRRAGDDGN